MRGTAAGGFRRTRKGRALALGAAVLVASSAAGVAGAAPADGPAVKVTTTGNFSEALKKIPITRKPGRTPMVVISMSTGQLPDLADGDVLEITAEFQVTGDCLERSPRCIGHPYHYAPIVQGHLVLADGPKTTSGPGALPLGRTKRVTCTQRHPQYKHHCVLTFEGAEASIADGALPCALDACYVNLVGDAHNPDAENGDVLAVGGLKPGGKIPQDRGRINAIRYRGVESSSFDPLTTEALHKRSLRPNFQRRVVISQRLDDLERGEQLAVEAGMTADISHLHYAVRTSAKLILADSPLATKPSAFVKQHTYLRGEISENNGSNCTQPEGRCTTRKVGVAAIRRDVVNGQGERQPLFINLVTVLGPKAPDAEGGDRIRIRHGAIAVLRFPADVYG